MSETPKTDRWEWEQECNYDVPWEEHCRELERENAALREQLKNVTVELKVTKVNALADKERLEADNAALRAELKRQRALWQATYALGLAERDFAIKCIETALGPNKAQSWGDDQIMRQCLNEGGTPT